MDSNQLQAIIKRLRKVENLVFLHCFKGLPVDFKKISLVYFFYKNARDFDELVNGRDPQDNHSIISDIGYFELFIEQILNSNSIFKHTLGKNGLITLGSRCSDYDPILNVEVIYKDELSQIKKINEFLSKLPPSRLKVLYYEML
ncbi:MAG: hypothetical protein AAB373_06665 [Patescibacteria group bacterium]